MWARHIPAVVGSIPSGAALPLQLHKINKVGYFAVLDYYLMPLFVFSSWLVIVTFLHHNEEDTVWYGDEWNYEGQSVIHRPLVPPLDSITHNIDASKFTISFPRFRTIN